MENNLNYDFTKLIDYQICFIPCYYGKSNSEVYDFSACYDKCSGITSINILFKTCYSDMLAFIGDFRDLVIVDTNICGTTCNDITMVDDGYGYIDFSDYYDLYDCYDCIDLNTGVYEGATSYGDFVTCIENEGYILDSYWFVYSFIYGYDVTSSVYTY